MQAVRVVSTSRSLQSSKVTLKTKLPGLLCTSSGCWLWAWAKHLLRHKIL